MAVRLSQATSKVGRGLGAPVLSSATGKASGRAQETTSLKVSKTWFHLAGQDAGRAIGKKAVIRAAFQEKTYKYRSR